MMITSDNNKQLDALLIEVSRELDIPASKYEQAVERYHTISEFLRNCPELGRLKPKVYVQGSMALGTMVAPQSGEEYDVDLTAIFDFEPKSSASSRQMVYDRFDSSDRYKDKIDDSKRRCIRLLYANEFHVDVIAAKPSPRPVRLHGELSIRIPDSDLAEWISTNPKGYAIWFLNKAREHQLTGGMSKVAASREQMLKEARELVMASTEPAPQQAAPEGKMPLQILVQILKKHRDVFSEGEEHAPISILITTLAARAITPESSIIETLRRLPKDMKKVIESDSSDGVWRVLNPTNEKENFADKWNEKDTPENRKKAEAKKNRFFEWIYDLDQSLEVFVKSLGKGTKVIEESLVKIAGSRASSSALDRLRDSIGNARSTGTLGVYGVTSGLSLIGGISSAATKVKPTSFYGD